MSHLLHPGYLSLAQELCIFLRAGSHLVPFRGGQGHLPLGIVAAESIRLRQLAIVRRRSVLFHDLCLLVDLAEVSVTETMLDRFQEPP